MISSASPLVLNYHILALALTIVLTIAGVYLAILGFTALKRSKDTRDLAFSFGITLAFVAVFLIPFSLFAQSVQHNSTLISWAHDQYGYDLSIKQADKLFDGGTIYLPDGTALAASFSPDGIYLVQRP